MAQSVRCPTLDLSSGLDLGAMNLSPALGSTLNSLLKNKYLIVVLICISLMVSDVEHVFMCLFSHLDVFFRKVSFISSAHVLNGLFVFWVLSMIRSL